MKIKSLLSAFFVCIVAAINAQNIHHHIFVNIDVTNKAIEATDSVSIPVSFLEKNKGELTFKINAGFAVKSADANCKIAEIKADYLQNSSEIKAKTYLVSFTKPNTSSFVLPLQYSGKVEGEIKEGAAEYARGFSETDGIISSEGVYFANSTLWVPLFGSALYTFNLSATIDSAYGIISQGARTKNEIRKDKKLITYQSENPSDEFYLIAGKWTEYNSHAGSILVQAELRKPDEELANKYMGATVGYLELYNRLIGAYPYSKFTLVENFWETGYGMPSFTLLGEKIIRLPFIINSSYPHELLHNYWGNSVYVDYSKGNWCEGLTAYMADHLFKEQIGQANEYRRSTLQKFTDFVNESNDFPLAKFQSRNNSAEEAVGYGKSSMVFEMLRYTYGDDVFRKAIATFYAENKFKMTSFDEVRITFEKVSGKDLKEFFNQWLNRTGAPGIALSNVNVKNENSLNIISFTLSQTQKEDVFNVMVPVVIFLEGVDSVIVKKINLTKREESFSFSFNQRPARIDVDPQFNVFRRISKEEVPPCISQIFGDKDVVMILPKSSPFIKEYTDLAEQWKQTQQVQGNNIEIKMDEDIKELPNKACWIIGFENKFAKSTEVFSQFNDVMPKETLSQIDSLKKNGAMVYMYRNPINNAVTNGFLGSTNQKMIAGLKRKIVHYTKYSYLGFEGDEATNKLKGEFPVTGSPLSFYIKYDGKTLPVSAKLNVRKALIDNVPNNKMK